MKIIIHKKMNYINITFHVRHYWKIKYLWHLFFFKSDKFPIFWFFLTFEAYYIFMASQKRFVHTHTHLNNIKRGKILYSNKELWKESLVPNLHRLALKLQLYQGNFLAIKREKATLSLSLFHFSVGILPLPLSKREKYQSIFC